MVERDGIREVSVMMGEGGCEIKYLYENAQYTRPPSCKMHVEGG